jgi:hypothetical protein
MTDSSSYSSSTVSTSGSGVTAGGSTGSSSASTDVTTLVQTSSPDDSTGMVASLSGDATAVGGNTLTAGNLSGTLIDGPSLTSAELSASMLAASQSPTGGVFAGANTSAVIREGSPEVVVGATVQSASSVQGPAGNSATATSTTNLAAFDIHPTAADAGTVIDTGANGGNNPLDGPDYAAVNLHIDGNVALIEFDAVVVGDDTFAGVDAFVLAVEDQLSVSGAVIELAVD